MDHSNITYALRYAEQLHWPVIPLHWITPHGVCSCGKSDCKSPGKHPLTKTGLKEASIDPEVIKERFKKWPTANIGIATGEVSGVYALDVDPRHGGDDSLDKIRAEFGKIPDDVMQVTGSGGWHYLFRYPGEAGRSTTNLYPGIDTRGDGGYIVVAPSNHISGKSYFWENEANPLVGAILPDAPAWLLAKLSEKKATPPEKKSSEAKLLSSDELKRIRAALGYLPADDRDQWRNVGMALNDTGAGDQAFGLWCEWSSQSDKFNLKDQRRVWDSFQPGGGITLATIFSTAKQNGWVDPEPQRRPVPPLEAYAADIAALGPEIKTRKPRKKKATPHVGNTAESLLEILKRYIFLKNHNRIYDTLTRNELSREGFDGAFCHLFPENKISMIFLNDPECVKVDGLIYLPGDTNNPVYRNGAVLWNIWCDPGVKLPDSANKEDVEPWREHLHYLYPDEKEQEHLLNWMACVLQKPQVKINHALLIAGTSRVGKDMLLNPLRYGLGAENICEPPAGELKESFTDYLHHSKLVIFQEIQTFEGLNLENKLKPMLAAPPDMLRVRLFGRGFYETPNLIQAIFMSNYRDALHISAGDGRYFAIWTDKEPLEPEYYKHLADWQAGGGNGMVVRWLLNRDISQFNPKQPAPPSAFKHKLLETSKSPLKHLLEDMIAAQDYPFNADVVRSIDIGKTLRDKYSSKVIGTVLSEIGCYQKTCKKSTDDRKKVSLYAVRNIGESVKDWRDDEKFKDKEWLDEYVRGNENRRNDWGVVEENKGQKWQNDYEKRRDDWE